MISTILRPYESVIASSVGHITVHEAGAIESTGHKINAIDTKDGKLKVSDIQSVLDMHTDEHMVKPKLVFISNSTELGSIYTKKELTDISHFCKIHQLYLYLDGARLGSALTSEANDLTLAELAQLVDIFYIGWTKNGALCWEAIVIMNDDLKENFRYCMKQKGALLAKSRLLWLQFLTFFQDDLFFSLAKHANTMASRLVEGIRKQSYSFLSTPVSNQIFPILPNELIERMSEKYLFYVWQSIDSKHSAIRLVTSWATKEEAVNQFIADLSWNMY